MASDKYVASTNNLKNLIWVYILARFGILESSKEKKKRELGEFVILPIIFKEVHAIIF